MFPVSCEEWLVDPLDKEQGFWEKAVLLQGLGVEKEYNDDD